MRLMRTRIIAINLRPCLQNRRSGLTLVELLATMVVSGILLTAMTSTMLIASHALPKPNSTIDSVLKGADIVEQMVEELHSAVSFTTRTANAVEFTVPDRNADSVPEVIRYAWSGTPGDPLTRRYNGGLPTNIAESAEEFNLAYSTFSTTTTVRTTSDTTSPEIVFSYFNGWPGVLLPTTSSKSLGPVMWGAEFFTIDQATIPNDAKNIRITRLRLMLQKRATSGSITLGIHRSVGGGNPQPATNSIGTPATVSVSILPLIYGWVDITMPSDVVLQQLNKEFVIVGKANVSDAADWQMLYSTSAPNDSTPTALWSSDSGSQWQPKKSLQSKQDFLFYAYGTYDTTSTVDQDVVRKFLQAVTIKLRLGKANSSRVVTAVQVLNEPEVN